MFFHYRNEKYKGNSDFLINEKIDNFSKNAKVVFLPLMEKLREGMRINNFSDWVIGHRRNKEKKLSHHHLKIIKLHMDISKKS